MAMKIYTKTGDKGMTSLIGGTKVSKGHLRIEAYGTIDELNSYIGIVQSSLKKDDLFYHFLASVQNNLFVMGSQLAADPDNHKMKLPELKDEEVKALEDAIDTIDKTLEPLKAFILPSGNIEIAQCHVARCICRRAERIVVRLAEVSKVDELLIRYLNRLSDFLFTLSRKVGKDFGVEEVIWQS